MSWAIITGASAGIGVEFAKLCAKDGHNLILVARRKDRMESLAGELKKENSAIKVEVIAHDLSKPDAAEKLYAKIQAITPDVDILINNAGFGTSGAFPAPNIEKLIEMIDLNVRTLVALTGLILPRMLVRKKGRILNVGSLAGFQPGPYMSIYYATKAFVNSFSEGLHEELQGTGVTCTVLTPGPVHTEFGEVARVNTSKLFMSPGVMNASEAALCGYKAMKCGKAIAIPGVSNKLIPQFLRLTPRALARKTSGWLNRSVQ